MSERNPWPEESDYGKLWRRGFDAGRSDALSEIMPAFERLWDRAARLSRITSQENQDHE